MRRSARVEASVSERRACRALGQPRSTQRYRGSPRTDEGELVAGGTVQLPLDGEELAVEVRTLSLSRGTAHLDLAGPTTVRFEGDGVQVEDVRLEGPLGALTVWAQIGGPQGIRVKFGADIVS